MSVTQEQFAPRLERWERRPCPRGRNNGKIVREARLADRHTIRCSLNRGCLWLGASQIFTGWPGHNAGRGGRREPTLAEPPRSPRPSFRRRNASRSESPAGRPHYRAFRERRQFDQVVERLIRGGIVLKLNAAAAPPLLRAARTRVIDQNLPHDAGRDSEEMGAVREFGFAAEFAWAIWYASSAASRICDASFGSFSAGATRMAERWEASRIRLLRQRSRHAVA